LREFQNPPRPSLPPTIIPASIPLHRIKSEDETDPELNGTEKINGDSTPPPPQKTQLRLDAYLSEWLSPGYFENTKPPPSSQELLDEAKKVLEKPAEEIKGADIATPVIFEFSGVDWETKESQASSTPIHEKTGLRAMAAAGHAMSKRPRRSFVDKSNGITSKPSIYQAINYNPPVPTYSIAPRESNWDSMKLDWGDGGPFGEEWSSMHRRFRTGLQKMISYYETEEESLVLILVTHQAGANALVRLLTGAPALHDIGTASLTLAVRREQAIERRISHSSPTERRRGSLDTGIADEYEMKIIASTEHLRGGSNPLGLNSPRLGKSPALASRKIVGADSPEGFSIGDPMTRSQSGHGNNLSRSLSQRSFMADDNPRIETGLWRRESTSTNSEPIEDDTKTPLSTEQLWGSSSEGRLGPSLPVRSVSQKVMWGAEGSIRRDRSPGKRRWTAVERSP
jgi:hypothetical protein